jgi:hypothetical protein
MGHYIHAIIAKSETLEPLVSNNEDAHLVVLSQGFAMVPLTEALYDSLPDNEGSVPPGSDKFEFLTAKICWQILELSQSGPIAYCETDYHGGSGSQGAIVWHQRAVTMPPAQFFSDHRRAPHELVQQPINAALHILGVVKGDDVDEFDGLGLGRFRNDEDWLEQPN